MDTLIRTPGGATLKISRGTFNQQVDLEIKEAYSISDMLLAGLITESNGRPLSSGGMIYINDRNGATLQVLKPIEVTLPSPFVNAAMKLYKGEVGADSTINWVAEDSVESSANPDYETGRQLFQQNCRTCHALNAALTGPALKGFKVRGRWRDQEELYRFIHNPASYMTRDGYTFNLKRQYGAIMQAFPQLSRSQIDVITFYLQEAKEDDPYENLPFADSSLAYDCYDTVFVKSEAPIAPMSDTTTVIDTNSYPDLEKERSNNPKDYQSYRKGFTDRASSQTGSYSFSIQTLGWYNVDAEVLGMPGTTLCELQVKVNAPEKIDLNVYAFFPLYKDLSVSNNKEDVTYSFRKVDGKIPLFLGADGFVVAFGSKGDQLYYGITHFKARRRQELSLTIGAGTEEEFLKSIAKGNLKGIDFQLQKQEGRLEYLPCNSMKASDSTVLRPK